MDIFSRGAGKFGGAFAEFKPVRRAREEKDEYPVTDLWR
jgi:hypothetical protein